MLQFINELDYLTIGWAQVFQLQRWEPNEQLRQWCDSIGKSVADSADSPASTKRRESVRALLRKGGYKPSGRNKPAQEYLLRCVREGSGLPSILPAVDVLNACSLQFGLPISMLGRRYFEKICRLRIGLPEETFIFNSGGQELGLEGLIVCAGGSDGRVPLGTPVKDSMAGKITQEDKDVVCVIYGNREEVTVNEIEGYAQELAMNLMEWGGAESISVGAV